jgi:3-hydroxymyristoyl/3-hydroxydecanoyl-(acyl carrier protein) dehydratase
VTVAFPIGDVSSGGASWRCSVRVPEDLAYFRGHFPDAPVLPAVAQLDGIVLACVRRAWPRLGPLRGVARAKFHRPIAPGDTLALELERTGPGAVRFALRRGVEPCSAGALLFEEEAGP